MSNTTFTTFRGTIKEFVDSIIVTPRLAVMVALILLVGTLRVFQTFDAFISYSVFLLVVIAILEVALLVLAAFEMMTQPNVAMRVLLGVIALVMLFGAVNAIITCATYETYSMK